MRDGVGARRVAVQPGAGRAVLEFLFARLPALDAEAWRARLDAGEVLEQLFAQGDQVTEGAELLKLQVAAA